MTCIFKKESCLTPQHTTPASDQMNIALYVPLQQWQCCIRVRHELLLRRQVTYMQVDSEDYLLLIPCTALGRDPTADEGTLLGVLVHQRRAWKGGCSLRQMETRGICTLSSVTRIADGVYDTGGDLFCVHGASVVMFEDLEHMQLYLSILEAGPLSFYSPLCSALAVEVGLRHSEVRLSLFEGSPSLLDQLHSETLWLRLVSLLWPGTESVSLEEWEAGRYKG
jgi:hypothetical protein